MLMMPPRAPKPSLLERVATAGSSLAAFTGFGVAAFASDGWFSGTSAGVSGLTALIGVSIFAAGSSLPAGQKQGIKLSQRWLAVSVAAAALSLGITAYDQNTRISELDSSPDNAMSAMTEFADKASIPQDNLRVLCEDNPYIFESGVIPCPGFTKRI